MPSAKNRKPLTVGLTGGIGSGKSTVLGFFHRLGASTSDADAIVHKELKTRAVLTKIRRRFGADVFNPGGDLNKKRLAKRVFNNTLERHSLERILHPLVRKDIFRKLKKFKGRVMIVDVPLLFESKLNNRFDVVVVVSSSLNKRLSRLKKRGMKLADIRKRVQAQWPLSKKIKKADFVIHNDGSLSQTRQQVRQLWKELLTKRGV